jgi:hypothetical protein
MAAQSIEQADPAVELLGDGAHVPARGQTPEALKITFAKIPDHEGPGAADAQGRESLDALRKIRGRRILVLVGP